MKKLVLAACALSCAASVFAQGTVVFNNRVVGSTVSHIYGANPANVGAYQSGNGANDTIAGVTDWSAFPLLDGAAGTYTVQLWSAPGLNQLESSLQAAAPATTMRGGAAAGFITGTTATLANVAGDSVGGATLMVRAWDNRGGTIVSWAAAQLDPSVLQGESALFNITAPIGGILNTPPNLVGLQSFNLHTTIPEPSTFALAGLGAAALLIFRRRK